MQFLLQLPNRSLFPKRTWVSLTLQISETLPIWRKPSDCGRAHRNAPTDFISFQWLLTGLIRQPFSVSLKTFQCQQTMRSLQCLFFITDGAKWSCAISSSSPKNWNRERPIPQTYQPDINIYIYIYRKKRRKKNHIRLVAFEISCALSWL